MTRFFTLLTATMLLAGAASADPADPQRRAGGPGRTVPVAGQPAPEATPDAPDEADAPEADAPADAPAADEPAVEAPADEPAAEAPATDSPGADEDFESMKDFIRAKLEEGLRGKALARAVVEERERRTGQELTPEMVQKAKKAAARAQAKYTGKPAKKPHKRNSR